MNIKSALLAVAVVAIPDSSARADHIVEFDDGRTLEVQGIEDLGDVAILDLGGGKLQVPRARIARWTLLEAKSAVPAVAMHDASARGARSSAARDYHGTPTRAARPKASETWRRAAGKYAEYFETAAAKHQIEPALLTAVAHVESRFNPAAVSPKGAQGMLQLMPATAERFNVDDPFDVAQNVDSGAKYLGWLLKHFDGQTDLALAGYNAGENAVDRYNGIPPYDETRLYVTRVMNQFRRLGGQ